MSLFLSKCNRVALARTVPSAWSFHWWQHELPQNKLNPKLVVLIEHFQHQNKCFPRFGVFDKNKLKCFDLQGGGYELGHKGDEAGALF